MSLLRLAAFATLLCVSARCLADTLDDIRARGTLVWGADSEGGGPFVYPDPKNPRKLVGFEVELAELLARELRVKPQFFQGPWDNLPALLNTGQIDIILNGYEMTGSRLANMAATHPYYVYQLALLTRRDDGRIKAWDDLARGPAKYKIGVLATSGAYDYLVEHYARGVNIVHYDGNTNAMRDVETGRLDGTIADLPVAIFYRDRFTKLHQPAPPAGRGYYAIFLRKDDQRLRDALHVAGEVVGRDPTRMNVERRFTPVAVLIDQP